jgi:hypothetical protein
MINMFRRFNEWYTWTHYSTEKIGLLLFGGLVGLFLIISTILSFTTITDVQVRIEDTGSMAVTSGKAVHDEWVVYTEHEVFKNTNSILHWKLNSHRIQAQLKSGMVCDVVVNGVGVRRRNILKVTQCFGG